MQLRRLDPLANAGPWQKLAKSPVKSFTLTQVQFDRVRERRPELVVIEEGVGGVVGFPNRDFLEIHYGFDEAEMFHDVFGELFERVVAASSRTEAPRGVVLSFRDRPNRHFAIPLLWSLTFFQGPEWVEMNWLTAPEQPEPANDLGDGYSIREAGASDLSTVANLDGEVAGRPPLSQAGVASLFENAKAVRIVTDASGAAAGYVALRTEPGGWGVIDEVALTAPVRDKLAGPVLRWATAWLRNNGGRRMRRRAYLDGSSAAELAVLKELGFTPGETGLDYTRPVEAADIKEIVDERAAHGTVIKFGDWR